MGTRTRSATMAPSASSTEAFSPVPPMSSARVKGWLGLGLAIRDRRAASLLLRRLAHDAHAPKLGAGRTDE